MLETGDIILVRSKGILGYLIYYVMNWFQKDPVYFNHVLVAINENEAIEAWWKIQQVNIKLSKYKRYRVWRYSELTDDQKEVIIKLLTSLLGKPYSIMRLGRQLLDHIFATNKFTKRYGDKFDHVCSTVASWAYYVACDITFNGVPWKSCEPDDIDDEGLANPKWMEVNVAEKNG